MRRHHPGPGRAAGLILALALGLSSLSGFAHAQATKKAPAPPAPPDDRPLARYLPQDHLYVLAECAGLDTQSDAWKKTAAYRLLNETPLGEMLEAMGTQLADKALSFSPNRKMIGSDVMTVAKTMISRGFIIGINSGGNGEDLGTLVFRGGASKDVRASFSRLMGSAMGESKPQVGKKGSRTVVTVPFVNDPKDSWTWWSEQNDLVVTLGKGTADAIIAVLDGGKPNAVDHPLRADLAQSADGFTPAVFVMVDPEAPTSGSNAHAALAKLTGLGIHRIDYRWGFHDDALMSVWRVKAPKPRKGVLAMFDHAALDKKELPPIPEGLEAFTALSINPDQALEAILTAVPAGEARAQVDSAVESLKTQAKIDVRADLLAKLGPKMAFYVTPGGTREGGSDNANPLAGLMAGGNPLAALSSAHVPKFTLIAEVADPVEFGKALDNVMVAVNRSLRERAAEAAKAAEAARPDAGGGGGERERERRAPPPSPEFRLMPGGSKVYTFMVPPAIAGRFPAGFRPTIRMAEKHVVIAATPDAARAATEIKPGAWAPSGELAPAFDQLPQSLMLLSVSDPRDTLPELLASLPANLQRGYNTVVALSQSRAAAGGGPGGPGAPGGEAAIPNEPGFAGAAPGPGFSATGGPAGASGSGGPPSGGSGGYPGAAQQSGGYPGAAQPGGGGPGAAASAPLQFNIDPSKLPKADDLRSRMFPAAFSVIADDEEIRLVNRESFPNLVSPGSAIGVALVLPAVQAARDAAARAGVNLPGPAIQPPGQPGAGPGPAGGPPPDGGIREPGRGRGPRGGAADR